MINLDGILKSRNITLPTKLYLVKAMVLPVIMYGCESWTIKKAERQRIDAFELWCWRRLLRALDCKEIQSVHPKGNQSWISFGRIHAEAQTPITLATWWEELTHWKRPWCWKRLRAGGEGTQDKMVGRYHQREFDQFQEIVKDREVQSVGSQGVRHNWATELNWTEGGKERER